MEQLHFCEYKYQKAKLEVEEIKVKIKKLENELLKSERIAKKKKNDLELILSRMEELEK